MYVLLRNWAVYVEIRRRKWKPGLETRRLEPQRPVVSKKTDSKRGEKCFTVSSAIFSLCGSRHIASNLFPVLATYLPDLDIVIDNRSHTIP